MNFCTAFTYSKVHFQIWREVWVCWWEGSNLKWPPGNQNLVKPSHCMYSMVPSNTIFWNHTHIGWKRLLLSAHRVTWPPQLPLLGWKLHSPRPLFPLTSLRKFYHIAPLSNAYPYYGAFQVAFFSSFSVRALDTDFSLAMLRLLSS